MGFSSAAAKTSLSSESTWPEGGGREIKGKGGDDGAVREEEENNLIMKRKEVVEEGKRDGMKEFW